MKGSSSRSDLATDGANEQQIVPPQRALEIVQTENEEHTKKCDEFGEKYVVLRGSTCYNLRIK